MDLEQKLMNLAEMAAHIETLSAIIVDLEDAKEQAEKLTQYSLELSNSNTYCGQARESVNKYVEYLNKHISSLERLLLFANQYMNLCVETAVKEDEQIAKVFEECSNFTV